MQSQTTAARLEALEREQEALRCENDLLWRVLEHHHRAFRDEMIAAVEHDEIVNEWEGAAWDGEAPSDRVICTTITATLSTVHDADGGATVGDLGHYVSGSRCSGDLMAAYAGILQRACGRGLLTCSGERPKRYRLADGGSA